MRTIIYYVILLSILLMTLGFISLFYQVNEERTHINRVSLAMFAFAMVGFLFISISRKYHIHSMFYFISLIMLLLTIWKN